MISICVHSTNRGKYLEKFLKSLTQQTVKDFEVVIVDNNSKDNTEEVIEKYKEKLDINYVKFSHKIKEVSNLNPLAYNIAVENAKYDKIILTVSDVIFDINNVKNALKLYDEKKVIYGRALQVNNTELVKNIKKLDITQCPELLEFDSKPSETIDAYFKVHETKIKQPVFYIAVFSKQSYKKIGGMDERFIWLVASSDVDLGFRLGCVAQVEYTDKLFVYHQKHRTQKIDTQKWNDGIKLRNQNHEKALAGKWYIENKKLNYKIEK